MVSRSRNKRAYSQEDGRDRPSADVDYNWVAGLFGTVLERLNSLESKFSSLGLQTSPRQMASGPEREYYSVREFAELVGKSEYTVREYCRYLRIHAEKCESGRGDAKSWKIPAEELQRYRDHGLLPATYLR
jgi:hypothetical protein